MTTRNKTNDYQMQKKSCHNSAFVENIAHFTMLSALQFVQSVTLSPTLSSISNEVL